MKKNLIVIIALLIALVGCKEKVLQEKVFKGYVIWEKDFTTFTNCETGKTYWLEDKTGEIENKYKSIAKELYKEVYFELIADLLPPSTTGVSSGFDNIMAVKTIVNAQVTPPQNACINKKEKPVFNCFGKNPNWSFGFGSNIRFIANHPKDTLVFFPLKEPEIRDSAGVGRVFYYFVGNENYQNIELIVTEQPCKIGKKYHRFSTKVVFGGEEYKGCATIKMTNDEEYSTD